MNRQMPDAKQPEVYGFCGCFIKSLCGLTFGI